MLSPSGRRFLAWVALSAFVGSIWLPLASGRHFAWDDDPACAGVPASGNAPAQFETANGAAPSDDHCALCHWLRAVGGARPAETLSAFAWLDPSLFDAAFVPPARVTLVVSTRTPRAPPTRG